MNKETSESVEASLSLRGCRPVSTVSGLAVLWEHGLRYLLGGPAGGVKHLYFQIEALKSKVEGMLKLPRDSQASKLESNSVQELLDEILGTIEGLKTGALKM